MYIIPFVLVQLLLFIFILVSINKAADRIITVLWNRQKREKPDD